MIHNRCYAFQNAIRNLAPIKTSNCMTFVCTI